MCVRVCAKLLQSCPTLCDSVDCSLLGSSVHRILQVRILEWIAMPSSRGSSHPRNRTRISYVSCIGRRVLLPLGPLGKPLFCAIEVLYFPLLMIAFYFFSQICTHAPIILPFPFLINGIQIFVIFQLHRGMANISKEQNTAFTHMNFSKCLPLKEIIILEKVLQGLSYDEVWTKIQVCGMKPRWKEKARAHLLLPSQLCLHLLPAPHPRRGESPA